MHATNMYYNNVLTFMNTNMYASVLERTSYSKLFQPMPNENAQMGDECVHIPCPHKSPGKPTYM